jgi:hypothetical protein
MHLGDLFNRVVNRFLVRIGDLGDLAATLDARPASPFPDERGVTSR